MIPFEREIYVTLLSDHVKEENERIIRYGWLVRRKGWWYKFPFLPIPPKKWLLWRLETAWGIDAMNPQWKDFPTIPVMLHDVYKFGHWLTQYK